MTFITLTSCCPFAAWYSNFLNYIIACFIYENTQDLIVTLILYYVLFSSHILPKDMIFLRLLRYKDWNQYSRTAL